jgi:hypothetical protein
MSCSFHELRKKLFVGVAVGCLLCCITVAQTDEQTVRTSHTPGLDFSKYHTYKWVEIKGQQPDPSADAQIKQSIDAQLAALPIQTLITRPPLAKGKSGKPMKTELTRLSRDSARHNGGKSQLMWEHWL